MSANALPILNDHPRVALSSAETSIDVCERLGAKLGISLSVKRDDTFSLALGGNKVRQLEYYFGQARAHGADTILASGALQSNFVRLCAAAARSQGWHPIVQLEERVSTDDPFYARSGNVLLDLLLGAELHRLPADRDEAAADANLDALASPARAQGRNPYVIHLGLDHPPFGGLGYVRAALEIHRQCSKSQRWPDRIVIGSGSGLSHAGLLVGARALGWPVPVHGICVRRPEAQQRPRVLRRAHQINHLLSGAATLNDGDVLVHDTSFPPGYGKFDARVIGAMHDAARQEALLLDPVYTGKVMAGLIDLIEDGTISRGESVLFVHTGGSPGLFAYSGQLTDSLGRIDPS